MSRSRDWLKKEASLLTWKPVMPKSNTTTTQKCRSLLTARVSFGQPMTSGTVRRLKLQKLAPQMQAATWIDCSHSLMILTAMAVGFSSQMKRTLLCVARRISRCSAILPTGKTLTTRLAVMHLRIGSISMWIKARIHNSRYFSKALQTSLKCRSQAAVRT